MSTKISRRQFLKIGAAATTAAMMRWELLGDGVPRAFAYSQSDSLQKFVQTLRNVGGEGIPAAASDGTRTWGGQTATHYTIDIGQFQDKLHPNLPNTTSLWGFGQGYSAENPAWTRHLGGIIVAKRDQPVQITFRNHLPLTHIIPVDDTLMGADGPQNRASVHLHGGFVPWISDGGPLAWFGGGTEDEPSSGPSFRQNEVLNPGAAWNEADVYYPNAQSARLMWYHDHAFGTTRINAYAGIASAYVIFDDYELSLMAGGVPAPNNFDKTLYLVFQDKIFVANNIEAIDPAWPGLMPASKAGDLWYAHAYEPARWALGAGGVPPVPSCIPEFFGDTVLVNGTVYPTVTLAQGQYRLRMLNACNARFLNPRLVHAKGTTFPNDTEPNVNAGGPGFIQIGTEGGFLPAPTMVNGPKQPLLLLAPAERADLIVDLRAVPAGSTLILYSDAAAPFPMGDGRYDYYPSNPKTPSSAPGYGPNTRTLLQIKVTAGTPEPTVVLPATFTPTDPFLVKQTAGVPFTFTVGAKGTTTIKLATGTKVQAKVRYLTLNEAFDGFGRLTQLLGTDQPTTPGKNPLFGKAYTDPATEVAPKGSYEIWEIINLTGDTHPIHFHLVNVQILSRQPFSTTGYAGGQPNYTGSAVGPDANELGWKETVRMNPGQVTRVLMKFDLPSVPFQVPASPAGGHEYVWHCHILEHEEHDMMRPLIVI